MEIIKQYCNMLMSPATWRSQDFMNGWYTGIGVALALILFFILLRIFIGLVLAPRRCRHITISNQDGDLEIAAEAITDLVKSLQPEFPHITFEKLKLYHSGSRQTVELLVAFNTAGGGMTQQFDGLKNRVREVLQDTFGINSIRKVSVHCHQVVIPTGTTPVRNQDPQRPLTDDGVFNANASQDSYKPFEHL